MATIREYFDTDAKAMTVHSEWTYATTNGEALGKIIPKVALDFEANAKYWYFYIPPVGNLSECLSVLFKSAEFSSCQLSSDGNGVQVICGHSDYSEKQTSDTLQFTRRVHLYVDYELPPETRATLTSEALSHGYFLSIRDHEYARKRSETEKPHAFVSHDSRDKDLFVRQLVSELSQNYCRVWYDEYSLNVGDSLRESIERGLKESSKCIVVLSKNFLSNSGWGKAEFDSIFTREILEKKNVILPIWLDVEVKDVYEYSPRLADKVGLPASLGPAAVAQKLAGVLRAGT